MKSLRLAQPHIIAVIGIPGSGKTFFAEKFTDTFSAPFINYDTIIELGGTSQVAAKRLFQYQLDELLKTKQSIIIEGLTDARADRVELQKKAKTAGYELLIVWVQTDPATAQYRATRPAKDRTREPLTDAEYERAAKRFATPSPNESVAVISGKHTYASQAKVVLKRLTSTRSEAAANVELTTPPRVEAPSRPPRGTIIVR